MVCGNAQHPLVLVFLKGLRSGRKTTPWMALIRHHAGPLAPIKLVNCAQVNVFFKNCQRSLFGATLVFLLPLSPKAKDHLLCSLSKTNLRNQVYNQCGKTSRNEKCCHCSDDQMLGFIRLRGAAPNLHLLVGFRSLYCWDTQVSVIQVVDKPYLHSILFLQNQTFP